MPTAAARAWRGGYGAARRSAYSSEHGHADVPDLKEDVMSNVVLLDAAGRRRSPATTPGFHAGRPPRNKGRRYPADPPKVQEIVAVMRAAGDSQHGLRLRALTVILWRAGL